MSRSSCLTETELVALNLGALPDEAMREAVEHIERCRRCEDRARALDGMVDPLIEALRRKPAPSPPTRDLRANSPRNPDAKSDERMAADLAIPLKQTPKMSSQENLSPPPVEKVDEDLADRDAAPTFDFLAPPLQSGELGRLGNFRIVKLLGQGGMGMVFQAEDMQLRRVVALKVMLPELARDLRSRQRFLREARAAAALKHDHVVTIHQVDEISEVPFLVMEFLEGESLAGRLEHGRWPTLAESVRIGRETALGLAAAHAKGSIHRDIKPANLWLEAKIQEAASVQPSRNDARSISTGSPTPVSPLPSPYFRVKLLDFGLVRSTGKRLRLTQSNVIVGTPAYMAPEQARGEELDHRCDLFSLGSVLYELLTGRPPFAGEDTISLLMALAMTTPTPIRELNPAVPQALADLIAQMLSKAPADRPMTALEVADRLRVLELELPPQGGKESKATPPETKRDDVTRSAPRHSGPKWPSTRWILTGLAAGLLFVMGPAYFFLMRSSTEDSRPAANPVAPAAAIDVRPPKRNPEPGVAKVAWHPPELVAAIGERRDRHWGKVASIAFSPDGQLIAAANGHLVHIWDVKTQEVRTILHGHTDDVGHVAFAPDGKTILSVSNHQIVRIWGIQEGVEWATLREMKLFMPPGSFGYNGKIIAVGESNGNVRLLNPETEGTLETWKAHDVRVTSVALAADGKSLASTTEKEHSIKLWDVTRNKKTSRLLKGHTGWVERMVFSPNGKLLASMVPSTLAGTSELMIWDVETATLRAKIPHIFQMLSPLCFSTDGKFLSIGIPEFVQVWDIDGGKEKQRYRVPRNSGGPGPESVAFAPDGRSIAAGITDGMVMLWDVPDEEPRCTLGGEGKGIDGVAFAPDGCFLAAARSDGAAIFSTDRWKEQAVFNNRDAGLEKIAVSSDGRILAGLTSRANLWFRDRDKKTDWFGGRDAQRHPASAIALSPDGKILAADLHADVGLWDSTGKLLRSLKGHERFVRSLAFAPDGKSLASGSDGEGILFFDSATGNVKEGRLPQPGPIYALAFDPDGKKLAAGASSRVQIWELAKEEIWKTLDMHVHENVSSVSISRAGDWLAASTFGGQVQLWELPGGDLSRRWSMPGKVAQVEFAPDGAHLALVNANGSVYILKLPPNVGGRGNRGHCGHWPRLDTARRLFVTYHDGRLSEGQLGAAGRLVEE